MKPQTTEVRSRLWITPEITVVTPHHREKACVNMECNVLHSKQELGFSSISEDFRSRHCVDCIFKRRTNTTSCIHPQPYYYYSLAWYLKSGIMWPQYLHFNSMSIIINLQCANNVLGPRYTDDQANILPVNMVLMGSE